MRCAAISSASARCRCCAALADFDKLDGKMQAKIAVRSTGASQRAIMSNLDGTVFAGFQDGAIRGLNVAQMIRSLTSGTLSGWQEGKEQTTDLTQLSRLVPDRQGPGHHQRSQSGRAAGADDRRRHHRPRQPRSLAFRVEPKLVMTTEGQGRAADPVGLGIPVVIDGPWAEPRIYPDMAGILDNPDAAYAKLKEMGKGLFGADGALTAWADWADAAGGTGAGGNGGVRSARRQARRDPGQSDPAGPRPAAAIWPPTSPAPAPAPSHAGASAIRRRSRRRTARR